MQKLRALLAVWAINLCEYGRWRKAWSGAFMLTSHGNGNPCSSRTPPLPSFQSLRAGPDSPSFSALTLPFCSTHASLRFTGGISFLGLYVLVFLVSSLSPGKCSGSVVLSISSAICCDLHSPTCSSLLFGCPKCPSTRYVYKWILLPPPPKIGVILSAPTAHLESVPPNSSAPHSFSGFHPYCYVCLPLPFSFHGCQNRKRKSPMWPYHPMVLPQDLNTHAWRASTIQPLLYLYPPTF